ncbi:contact-dependent growth inhibition system immunity protein [Streptomyces althioticus]|uniref:contact-dependent growth inhibition system immunity protein n=1 Tax=Streptomyces althioticus TaxID=83380 RepID=UPI00340F1F14
MSQPVDPTQSLERLEGQRWPEPPEDATPLVIAVHELRRRPVGDLRSDELARLITQDVGLPWLQALWSSAPPAPTACCGCSTPSFRRRTETSPMLPGHCRRTPPRPADDVACLASSHGEPESVAGSSLLPVPCGAGQHEIDPAGQPVLAQDGLPGRERRGRAAGSAGRVPRGGCDH